MDWKYELNKFHGGIKEVCVEEEGMEGEKKRKRKEAWDVPFRKA